MAGNQYKEGAPFLATGGFRTAVQRQADDRRLAREVVEDISVPAKRAARIAQQRNVAIRAERLANAIRDNAPILQNREVWAGNDMNPAGRSVPMTSFSPVKDVSLPEGEAFVQAVKKIR